ncbi:hypothetical protein SCHPADRAFT_791866, partial [Schizopora paradoxa]
SIASLFPHVPQDILFSVLRHELRAEDLYKLDFRFREQPLDMALTVNKDGQLRYAGPDVGTRYRTAESLTTPFINYTTILTIHSISTGSGATVIAALHEYLHQLNRNIAEYDWQAVVAYHMAFWSFRCYEMRQGHYSGWAMVDQQLHAKFLMHRVKRSH